MSDATENFRVDDERIYNRDNNNNYSHNLTINATTDSSNASASNLSAQVARLLERTNDVGRAIRGEVERENELVGMVERLLLKVNSDISKRTEEGKGMQQRIDMDSSRSTNAEQLHEELTEEFMEFCKWHFVEPRFNIVWRFLNKLGLYLRVFLSFIFVFPFIAIYSKALRFYRRRMIVKRSTSNHNARPGWTIQLPYDSGNADHDFGAGLAQLVSNPLRFSGNSLRDELESMGNFSSDNDESQDLRRFVVGNTTTSASAITPTVIPASKTPTEINVNSLTDIDTDIDVETKVGDVDEIEASSPAVATKEEETKSRSRSRDKATARSKDDSTRTESDGNNDGKKNNASSSDKRSRSGNVDVPAVPDADEERAGWALQDNQESVWVDGDSQNSRDFWDSFGARSQRSSRS